MGLYSIIISIKVRKKDLPKIPEKDRKRVLAAIEKLAREPRPAVATRLTNREEYRLRQGDYRILYTVDDAIRIVAVRKVAHRKDVYKAA